MSGLRAGPRDARVTSFGFFLLVFGVFPNTTGYQDLGALLARQSGVAERWQKQVLLPSIGKVQVATFNFARPIGTSCAHEACTGYQVLNVVFSVGP